MTLASQQITTGHTNIDRRIGRRWIWRLLLPAGLISGLVGFPRGRKLEVLPGPAGAPPCVGATDLWMHTRRNSDAQTNSPQLHSLFQPPATLLLFFILSCCVLFSVLAHTSPKQGQAVLSHCKVIRRWAKQQGSSAGSHV